MRTYRVVCASVVCTLLLCSREGAAQVPEVIDYGVVDTAPQDRDWVEASTARDTEVVAAGQRTDKKGASSPPARNPKKQDEPQYTLRKDIEYARAGNHALLLDLYLPRNSPPPYPLVIRIHGGGWRSGSKDSKEGVGLIRLGFALASINYRLSQEAVFPAQIHDCKAAVRFLRANAAAWSIDENRIGVWGTSSGAHLAALLGTTGDIPELEGNLGNPGVSSRVQAVLDASGPIDLTYLVEEGDRVKMLLGGPVSKRQELARAASPIFYVTPDDPPFLVINGERDVPTLVTQGRLFADVLQKTGVPVHYYLIAGAGHDVLDAIRGDPKLAPIPFTFFEAYLR